MSDDTGRHAAACPIAPSPDDVARIREELGGVQRDIARMASSLAVLRWIAGASIAAVIAWAAWLTVTTIRTESATATTAREYHEHAAAPRHTGSDQLVVEIRDGLTELRAEARRTREVLTDMQTRLRQLEERQNRRER
ncbi:MAG: hypothetical protein IT379_39355 [Deltaproteobacteria bacterium]|nr:hypothetical protein [Deltaproteobacteria bacterium]